MKKTVAGLSVVLWTALAASEPAAQPADADRTVTEAQYEQWKTELTNWGRWGADDEIGALNLVTPAKRLQAVALVEEGITVSLAGDADTVEAVDNPNPYEHTMLGISSDRIAVSYHGISHTHLDALAHINDDGVFYNGYAPDPDTVVEQGHEKNSIHNLKSGIVTRGILIDIPRCGACRISSRTPIYVEDLRGVEEHAGVRVSAGDGPVHPHRRLGRRAREARGCGAAGRAVGPRGCIPRSSRGSRSGTSR